jgi:hypothetical protein
LWEGVGVAVVVSRFTCLVAIAASVAFGTRAEALSISAPIVAKGVLNTLDNTTNTGQNFMQTTSAVSTTLAPTTVPDTLGQFSEFTTRYAMTVALDRQMTSGSATTNMTSSYSITFTVNNPTGATVKIDIDTLRVGALTLVDDSTGTSTITLGAATGQLNAVTQVGLAAPAASLSSGSSGNTPFSQAGTTVSITTNAVASVYVLQFDWTSSVMSSQDEGAVRMGMPGGVNSSTADDYPGVGSRTQNNDGHFVDVKATIIGVVPEPGTATLLVFGLTLLARRRARTSR